MAIQSYSDLKATIADWLNRADLTATIPGFISLAEADISRRFASDGPPLEMIAYAQSPISQEFEVTPPDFMGVVTAYLDGAREPLDFSSVQELATRKANSPSASGNPTAYAVMGAMFQFWPAPTSTLQVNLFYLQRVQPLTDGITSNWVLKLHPDCYLYASLLQSAPYLKNDDRVATWQARYDAIVASVCAAGKRAQQGSYISVPAPAVVV